MCFSYKAVKITLGRRFTVRLHLSQQFSRHPCFSKGEIAFSKTGIVLQEVGHFTATWAETTSERMYSKYAPILPIVIRLPFAPSLGVSVPAAATNTSFAVVMRRPVTMKMRGAMAMVMRRPLVMTVRTPTPASTPVASMPRPMLLMPLPPLIPLLLRLQFAQLPLATLLPQLLGLLRFFQLYLGLLHEY